MTSLRVRARPIMAAASLFLVCVLAASLASAFEVQACVQFSGAVLQISDDPKNCAAGNKIDAVSVKVSFEGGVPTTTGGGGGYKAGTPGPLVLAKHIDQSSPPLFVASMTATLLNTVLVVIFDRGAGAPRGARLFSMLLTDARISSLEDGAQDSRLTAAGPLEMVTFDYARIRLRDDTSGTETCFDFTTGFPC